MALRRGRVVRAGDGARLIFEMGEVLDRVADRGDLFAPVLSLRQDLAIPAGAA